MKLIRCATVSVADLDRARDNYCQWLGYQAVEAGVLDSALAESWNAPESGGARYAVLQPGSGRKVYLRLIENPPHPDYKALRTYGWNAIEVCVQDVLRVAQRMADSPYQIIGPPKQIEGVSAIFPMQVQAPDGEIVYLTEIRDNLPDFDLPRAKTLIDCLFILVMGCSDLPASLDWIEQHIKLDIGRREMAIVYTMIAKAYNLPEQDLHVIATMVHGRDVFVELDQYPDAATPRPQHAGHLLPGIALGSFVHPQFDAVATACESLWIRPPAIYDSCVYDGRLSATVAAPDGTLFEVIDGR